MAQKRMFDKRVVESDKFTDLPNSSKALYFMAGMSADDKGFFQPRRLQKMCGFTDDDFKILIAKGFFIAFESGVMVVTDWNKNNWLDSRRITETEYVDELKLLKLINEKYELLSPGESVAKPMLSQNSIEENRIEKNRLDKNNICAYLEQNFGRTISPLEYEKLNAWLETFSEEMVKEAINKAVLNNKKTFSYIQGILRNWKTNNITTIEETQKQTDVPDWFGKEIPKEEISEKEREELENILAGFD